MTTICMTIMAASSTRNLLRARIYYVRTHEHITCSCYLCEPLRYCAHTATCPVRMLSSRVVCPRAVPQRIRTKCLSVAARARFAPPSRGGRGDLYATSLLHRFT
eukprot:5252369-Prymnesium_polylepis.1